MMSVRSAYGSAMDWLSDVRRDDSWLSQRRQLETAAAADMSRHREDALRRIGRGPAFEYFEIYRHEVEHTVREVWEDNEVSLPKLKIQTIGMLSMEWIEQHAGKPAADEGRNPLEGPLASDKAMKYWIRLQKAGFVDANRMLRQETTRQQAMYIADAFAVKLGIKSKWKTFEQLWSINHLAQEKYEMQETGKMPHRSQEIDKIFED